MATNKFTSNKAKNEKPSPAASPVARTEMPAPKPAAAVLKSTAPVKAKAITMPSDDDIRIRAYEIFVSEGCQEGQDLQNWLRAERELRQDAAH
jgi:hypothetical protein